MKKTDSLQPPQGPDALRWRYIRKGWSIWWRLKSSQHQTPSAAAQRKKSLWGLGGAVVLVVLGAAILSAVAPWLVQDLGLHVEGSALIGVGMALMIFLGLVAVTAPGLLLYRFWRFVHLLNWLGWEAEVKNNSTVAIRGR
jgi:hypothetical protein